jgi:hypothetical protein
LTALTSVFVHFQVFHEIEAPDKIFNLSHIIGMRQKLTARLVETLPTPKVRRIEVHDELLPGLRLRVFPTGRKTWSVVGRIGREQVRHTLGRYPTITLSEAVMRPAAFSETCNLGPMRRLPRSLKTTALTALAATHLIQD